MRSLCLLLIGGGCAIAQPFGVGLKVGIPFTDFVDNVSSANINSFRNPQRYILGVAGEVRLPFGLAIEADALYRHVKYSGTAVGATSTLIDARGGTWEFPVLAKYRFAGEHVRPFVSAGVAWNRLHGLTETVGAAVTGGDIRQASNTTRRGLVVGAGLDVKALFLHIQPEIRYTRWNAKRFFDVGDYFRGNENQASFLLGVSF